MCDEQVVFLFLALDGTGDEQFVEEQVVFLFLALPHITHHLPVGFRCFMFTENSLCELKQG